MMKYVPLHHQKQSEGEYKAVVGGVGGTSFIFINNHGPFSEPLYTIALKYMYNTHVQYVIE